MRYAFLLLMTLLCTVAKAQFTVLDSIGLPSTVADNYVKGVDDKLDKLTRKLDRQTRKAIRLFNKQEARLKRMLMAKDSAASMQLFNGTTEYLQQLQTKYAEKADSLMVTLGDQYNACTDKLNGTLQFLRCGKDINDKATAKLNGAISKLGVLQQRMAKAKDIKRYMHERKKAILQQLKQYGLGKQLKKIDKAQYYYGQYIAEYKNLLQNPKRIEQKVLAILQKQAFYRKFITDNSVLAGLFNLPGASTDNVGSSVLAGLQTRTNVNGLMVERLGASGSNAQQVIQQQVQQGMAQLQAIKDRAMAGSNGSTEIPSFKPSPEKTKSFFNRLEIQANIQFAKSSQYFPTMADIGFGLGYRLRFGSVGVGLSYKIGLGTSWKNICLSNNGMGLRTYIDIKLKEKLLISGGYEWNYCTGLLMRTPTIARNNTWQQSGLLGLSKKMVLRGKKAMKLSLLWDFLSHQNLPQSQPIVFRYAYSLK